MRQHDGFILLEMLAFFLVTCVVLLSLSIIHNSIVSMMLRHNMQKDGFEIAQMEMANLEQGSGLAGGARKEKAEFEIETKIEKSRTLAETNRLEVIVYEKGKTKPLVNLVRYE